MAFSGSVANDYDKLSEGDRPVFEYITNSVLEYVRERSSDGCGGGGGGKNSDNEIKILSLGDGTGEPGLRIASTFLNSDTTAPYFSGKCFPVTVYSTDISDQMQSVAKGKWKEKAKLQTTHQSVKVEFLKVSADDSDSLQKSFADRSIDVIILSFSLMFVPDKQKCIDECARMLKPGGRIMIAVLHEYGQITMMEKALGKLAEMHEKSTNLTVKNNESVRKAITQMKPIACLALKEPNAVEKLLAQARTEFGGEKTVAKQFSLTVKTTERLKFQFPVFANDTDSAIEVSFSHVPDDQLDNLESVWPEGKQEVLREIVRDMIESGEYVIPDETRFFLNPTQNDKKKNKKKKP